MHRRDMLRGISTAVAGGSPSLAGPGELTEGWVAFAGPSNRSLENGVVSWRPAHFDGPIRVDWGPEL